MTEAQPVSPFPLAKADLCVKCGLCLPHCPTYQETRNEADSPRGRITLMQGLANGTIPWSEPLHDHLEGCLSCRSCERVCPAKVPYGELIDAGRTMLRQHEGGTPQLTRALSPWLTSRRRRRLARALLRIYQSSGLAFIANALRMPRWPGVGRWISLLPTARAGMPMPGADAAPRKAHVQLFRGCVGDIADADTLHIIRGLLERCGVSVEEPETQTCCGALYQHAGEPQEAAPLCQRNVSAFSGDAPVLYAASGCGATLQEYGLIEGSEAARQFAARVRDPHRFLLEHWPQNLKLRPLKARVAVHLPCTQRNVTGGGDAILSLLAKIPDLQIETLDPQHGCCGAAGTYFVSQPGMADRLLEHKLDALGKAAPDYLVSSNIGCTLHIAAGLRRRGLKVRVLHPLALLAQQWPSDR